MKLSKKLYNDQAGIASIIVTMVMVIVVTIIVLALAQIARREQQQVLNKELSSQAFYTAEAGINDVKNAIQNYGFNTNYSNCPNAAASNPPGTYYIGGGPNSSSVSKSPTFNLPTAVTSSFGAVSASSQYTCVFTNEQPTSLEFGAISLDNAAYSEIKTINPASGLPLAMNSLQISWDDGKDDFRNCTGKCTFPSKDAWVTSAGDPAAPVLRLDVTAINGTGANGLPASFGQQDIIDHTMTLYLYPKKGAGGVTSVPFVPFKSNPAASGQIISGDCKTNTANPRDCNVSLQFSGGLPSDVFIRLSAIYGTASVSAQAQNGATILKLDGGQVVIDVTGRAANVLRRLQARISPRPSPTIANSAADTTLSICKIYEVAPSPTGLLTTCP